MGMLRRIDARQMADEPLVQKRSVWLKEREDNLECPTRHIQHLVGDGQTNHEKAIHPGLRQDKGKQKEVSVLERM